MPAKISITLTSEEHDLLREVVTLAKEAALAEANEHSKGHDAGSIQAARAAMTRANRLDFLGRGIVMTTTDTGRIVDDVRSQVRSQVERLAALVDYWRDRALTAEAGQPITESGESTIDVHKEVFSPTHPMTPDERAFAEQATARSAESGRRRRPLDPAPPLSCTGLADERVVPDAESSS